MRKSILTLGIAAVLTGVLATCSMAYAADDELAQIQESGKLKVGVEGTILHTPIMTTTESLPDLTWR